MGVRSIIKSIYSTFALNDNQNQQTSTHQYDLPTYKIALTVILGFTIIFFIALIGYPDKLELVGAIWGVLIGAIIGYFFGSKPLSQFSDGNENLGQQLARSQEESKTYEISVLNETAKKNQIKSNYMNSLENSILQLKNYKLLLPQEAGNLTPSAIDNFIDKLEKEKQNIEKL